MKCSCGKDVDGAKFCGGCGKAVPQPLHCQGCGTAFKDGEKFCSKCGKPSPAEEAAQALAAAQKAQHDAEVKSAADQKAKAEAEAKHVLLAKGVSELHDIAGIAKAMKDHEKDSLVITAALQAAAAFVNSADPKDPKKTQAAPLVELAVAGMKTHDKVPTLVSYGADFLKFMCRNDDQRKHVVAAGGIVVIINAMKANPAALNVQMHVCEAIGNLCYGVTANKDVAVKAGMVEAITTAIKDKSHGADVAFLADAFTAYNMVCSGDEAGRVEAGKLGVIELIMATWKAHKAAPTLIVPALQAIRALVTNGDGITWVANHANHFNKVPGVTEFIASFNGKGGAMEEFRANLWAYCP